MCNEDTEAENESFLRERARMSRRELGAGAAAAAVLAGCGGAEVSPKGGPEPLGSGAAPSGSAAAAAPATKHEAVVIDTPAGQADAFFVAPAEGRHPGVLMWPDVVGLREAYQTMGTRLAEAGFAVLVVNPYYRAARAPVMRSFEEWRKPEGRAKLRPMIEALTHDAVTADAGAYVAWLDARPEVDPSQKLGTMGYCMSGPFTFRTAAASERVGALGSFHGGGLVTEEETSPHKLVATIKAAALICIAQNDDARDPEHKSVLREAVDAASLPAEIEVYPAQHGWCTIDAPIYDETQAEKAWSRVLAWFGQHL